jgi:hypothetical protein
VEEEPEKGPALVRARVLVRGWELARVQVLEVVGLESEPAVVPVRHSLTPKQ